MKKEQTILVRITKETFDHLKLAMHKTGDYSKSSICRKALVEYLGKIIEVKKKTKLT